MKITLTGLGKKFTRDWIFRNVNHIFEEKSRTAILGANGSGKSTLLQVIAGFTSPSEGQVTYARDGQAADPLMVHAQMSFASPYLELMEDFTFPEAAAFQEKFRPWMKGMDHGRVMELSGLRGAGDKLIRTYSSGMKQRARLALAILSDSPVLLLDEPCSNLDKQGQEWYASLISDFGGDRTIVVCSNQVKEEYFFCQNSLEMERFKGSV